MTHVRPDTDAALHALGEGDILRHRPTVLYVGQGGGEGCPAVTPQFDLIWAADAAAACSVLKGCATNLAAIVIEVDLPGSRLDGVQLARLLRGMAQTDSLLALPEYARTVPVSSQLPIIFVSRDPQRDAQALAVVGGPTKVYGEPVDYGALVRDLGELTIRLPASAASQLLITTSRAAVSPQEMVRLVESEPGLRERLEQLVELGSLAGSSARTSSLSELTVSQVRPLLCCIATFDLLPQCSGLDAVYANVLRRGAAATLVGQRLGLSRPRCFALGLLLDSALMARAHDDPGGAEDVARTPALARTVREQAAGIVPHSVAGAHIARSWGIEDELTAAVEQHHNDGMPPIQISQVAWVAERIAAAYEGGDPAHQRRCAVTVGSPAGLGKSDVRAVLSEVPTFATRMASAFGRDVPRDLVEGGSSSTTALSDLHRNYRRAVVLLASVTHERDALATRLRAANARLNEYAATDLLTRLANRKAFETTLKRQLDVAVRAGLPLSLIIADIDELSLVNSDHGELVGDEVLCTVADLVRRSIRSGDFCARAGGEEFAVILLGSGRNVAWRVAERIRSRIDASRVASREQGRCVQVTASFGVVVVEPPLGANAGQLVQRACDAVEAAKNAGRNRIHVA